ncbi:MAG TPA: hypothetical protein VE957_17365 [Terriglobales bacterium]|nr:hypothetical protein [Terriglobales bacterium]
MKTVRPWKMNFKAYWSCRLLSGRIAVACPKVEEKLPVVEVTTLFVGLQAIVPHDTPVTPPWLMLRLWNWGWLRALKPSNRN